MDIDGKHDSLLNILAAEITVIAEKVEITVNQLKIVALSKSTYHCIGDDVGR